MYCPEVINFNEIKYKKSFSLEPNLFISIVAAGSIFFLIKNAKSPKDFLNNMDLYLK